MNAMTTGNLGDIVRRDAADGGWLDLADGRRWTTIEIDDAAARLAAGLVARGHKRGDRIAMLAANSVPFVIAYLGLLRAGIVAVPVSIRVPAETVGFILKDCGATLALVDDVGAALLPPGFARHTIADLDALMADNGMAAIVPEDEELAEILYTSGSTGMPKGVPLSHSGQMWALRRFVAVSSPAPERTIIAAPAYHMNGLFFSTVALALGYFVISMPRFDARTYLQQAAEHRCTLLSGIPTMFALMAREKALIEQSDLSSVTDIIIGSAPLTQALIDRVTAIFPNASVRNSYGTTETGPAMFGPHPDGLVRPPLALGYPYPDVEWRLVDGASANQGVLETRTPATTRGYLNLPDVTAKRLNDGWYATGDIVRHDDLGFFYFVGRADDMFVCGGENIYPGEVEKLLERHPDVLEAAVLPADDEIKGTVPIAFVVAVPGRGIDPEAVKRFALEHGPAYAHPRAVVPLDAMPTGGTHKIDRKALAQRVPAVVAALGR
jgi:long-chain acyl-CoA synthetase